MLTKGFKGHYCLLWFLIVASKEFKSANLVSFHRSFLQEQRKSQALCLRLFRDSLAVKEKFYTTAPRGIPKETNILWRLIWMLTMIIFPINCLPWDLTLWVGLWTRECWISLLISTRKQVFILNLCNHVGLVSYHIWETVFNHICKQGNKTELNVESSGQAAEYLTNFKELELERKTASITWSISALKLQLKTEPGSLIFKIRKILVFYQLWVHFQASSRLWPFYLTKFS